MEAVTDLAYHRAEFAKKSFFFDLIKPARSFR